MIPRRATAQGGRSVRPKSIRGVRDARHGLTGDSHKHVTSEKERHSEIKVIRRRAGSAVASQVVESRETGVKQTIRVFDAESHRPGGPVRPGIGDGETEGRGGAVPTRVIRAVEAAERAGVEEIVGVRSAVNEAVGVFGAVVSGGEIRLVSHTINLRGAEGVIGLCADAEDQRAR